MTLAVTLGVEGADSEVLMPDGNPRSRTATGLARFANPLLGQLREIQPSAALPRLRW
jgi:hypothetical protein